MSRKQSLADRLDRINHGRCPIHGLFMSQVNRWYYPANREPYTIVGCPRRDCNARAKANSYDGPWEILPECAHLLDESTSLPAPLKRQQGVKASYLHKSTKEDIWTKTDGKCYYCGIELDFSTTFCVDHIIPRVEGGGHDIYNVVPACRSCNSAKGTKSVEEFRFYRSMQHFGKLHGVMFTLAQIEYLESIGVNLDIPTYTFWFEL